jgi:hypothetical protein
MTSTETLTRVFSAGVIRLDPELNGLAADVRKGCAHLYDVTGRRGALRVVELECLDGDLDYADVVPKCHILIGLEYSFGIRDVHGDGLEGQCYQLTPLL